MIKISDKISYIKTNINPLSCDIGVIHNNEEDWLFDVGNGENNIKELNKSYNVVLSHFHIDHIGNINLINIKKLYASKETYNHLPKDIINKCEVIIVNDEININNIRIFLIPSSHSKGSLCLELDNQYTFIGDAIYCKYKNNKKIYNAQLLKEEINILENIKSEYLLISHLDGFIKKKEDVINDLKEIYSKRNKNSSEIII